MKKNIKAADKKKQNQNSHITEPGKTLMKRVQELRHTLKESESWRGPRRTSKESAFSVGIDLGDKKSRFCFLDAQGGIVTEDALRTTQEEFKAYFSSIPKTRIAIEVGTHSPWVFELLESFGHTVYVANPRRMESIHKNRRKNDKVDARTLARLVRADPTTSGRAPAHRLPARHRRPRLSPGPTIAENRPRGTHRTTEAAIPGRCRVRRAR